MPGFDGMGPRGQGAMTGGGRGYCIAGWNGIGRRGFGLQRAPRRGAYGAGRWWNDASAYVDAPIPNADALMEQIERLTERVEALGAKLEAQERGGA